MLTKDRFEKHIEKITESGCWIWTGCASSKKGTPYGRFSFGGKVRFAHRISFLIYNGVLFDDLCVLHRCDVPSCVNPNHLFLGTKKDNAQDMTRKGRGIAKLTAEQVLAIRKDKRAYKFIAKDYGVGIPNVSMIKTRTNWTII